MKRILAVASILGIATVVKIGAGALRAKFLAWQIGPAGVGIVSQALMYSMFAIQLCSLNMGMGLTKYISDATARQDRERVSLVVNTALTLQCIVGCLFIIAVLPFSRSLTQLVFADVRYLPFFIGITLVTPAAVYLVGIVDPVFYGLRKISEYTRLMIIYTLAGLLLVFILVWFYKAEGMLAQIVITSLLGFGISYYFLTRKIAVIPRLDGTILKKGKSRQMAVELLRYGMIAFLPGVANMCTLLYLRSLFIRHYGIEANGLYQVAYAMSAYYLSFVMNGIWGHFYPEMCALNDAKDFNREINQFVRFAIFATTAIAAGVIILKRYAILILFSDAFLKAEDLLVIQSVSDIFYILFCMFSVSLMARKKFKAVICLSTVGYNAVLAASYVIFSAMPALSLRSLNTAILAANVISVAALALYHLKDTGFSVNSENMLLCVKSAVLLSVVVFIPDRDFIGTLMKFAILGAWFLTAATRQELQVFTKTVYATIKGRTTRGG